MCVASAILELEALSQSGDLEQISQFLEAGSPDNASTCVLDEIRDLFCVGSGLRPKHRGLPPRLYSNESPGCLILIRHVEPEKPERLDSFHYIRTLAKVDQLARPGANADLVKRSFRFFKAPVRLPLRFVQENARHLGPLLSVPSAHLFLDQIRSLFQPSLSTIRFSRTKATLHTLPDVDGLVQ